MYRRQQEQKILGVCVNIAELSFVHLYKDKLFHDHNCQLYILYSVVFYVRCSAQNATRQKFCETFSV